MTQNCREWNVTPFAALRFPDPANFRLFIGNENIHEPVPINVEDADPVICSIIVAERVT